MGPGSEVDGRSARRDRNREQVLDAVLALFAEGHLEPSAPEVAARSGLSPRSVFRYFADREDLAQAAMARNLERSAPLWALDGLGEGPLAERAARFAAARVRLHDGLAPIYRAAVVRAPQSPPVAARLLDARERVRAQTEAHFAPELDRPGGAELAAALDALTQLDSVEHLRVRRGLDVEQARAVLELGVLALLR